SIKCEKNLKMREIRAFMDKNNYSTNQNEIQPFSDKNLTNATETIQVFFSSPDTMQSYSTTSIDLKSLNPYNNSYYIELFNETYSPIPNNITAFLSSNFTYLENMWKEYLSDQLGITLVSMDLIATLNVISNNTEDVYVYYNNILFNPMNVEYFNSIENNYTNWFNNTPINPHNYNTIIFPDLFLQVPIYFNLSNPTFVINSSIGQSFVYSNIQSNKIMPFIIPGEKPGIYYVPVNYTNLTGPLPLVGVHLNYPACQSQIDQGASFIAGSATLNFNSNMVSYSTSSESYKDLMSTTPSLSKSAPFEIGENQFAAYPLNFAGGNETRTTAVTWLNNATYYVVHYNIIEVTSSSSIIYLGNATDVKISNINTVNGFQVSASWVPVYLFYVLQNLSLPEISVGTLKPMQSLQGYNVWDIEQGYSNAASVYKNMSNACDVFATAIDLGLALIDVYAGITDALGEFGGEVTVGEIVVKSLQLISTTLSFSANVLSDFASISFLSSTTITGFGYSISNEPLGDSNGSPVSLTDYQTMNTVSFYDSQNGETYYLYMPMNFIIGSQP
ncbi:MAG: hypothetical protein ACP5TO_03870, partial [Thermoplasmata archaeon]